MRCNKNGHNLSNRWGPVTITGEISPIIVNKSHLMFRDHFCWGFTITSEISWDLTDMIKCCDDLMWDLMRIKSWVIRSVSFSPCQLWLILSQETWHNPLVVKICPIGIIWPKSYSIWFEIFFILLWAFDLQRREYSL